MSRHGPFIPTARAPVAGQLHKFDPAARPLVKGLPWGMRGHARAKTLPCVLASHIAVMALGFDYRRLKSIGPVMNSAPGAQPSPVQTGILLMILAVSMFAVMEAIATYMLRPYPTQHGRATCR